MYLISILTQYAFGFWGLILYYFGTILLLFFSLVKLKFGNRDSICPLSRLLTKDLMSGLFQMKNTLRSEANTADNTITGGGEKVF